MDKNEPYHKGVSILSEKVSRQAATWYECLKGTENGIDAIGDQEILKGQKAEDSEPPPFLIS